MSDLTELRFPAELALPILAWALKDEDWGISRKAAEALTEMGPVTADVFPDLATLDKRRLDHGPFHYEDFCDANNGDALFTVIAMALGRCGRGIAHPTMNWRTRSRRKL